MGQIVKGVNNKWSEAVRYCTHFYIKMDIIS